CASATPTGTGSCVRYCAKRRCGDSPSVTSPHKPCPTPPRTDSPAAPTAPAWWKSPSTYTASTPSATWPSACPNWATSAPSSQPTPTPPANSCCQRGYRRLRPGGGIVVNAFGLEGARADGALRDGAEVDDVAGDPAAPA